MKRDETLSVPITDLALVLGVNAGTLGDICNICGRIAPIGAEHYCEPREIARNRLEALVREGLVERSISLPYLSARARQGEVRARENPSEAEILLRAILNGKYSLPEIIAEIERYFGDVKEEVTAEG